MSNVRINFVLPTTRVDNSPLPVDQIAYVRIEARTGTFPFTEVAKVPPTETTVPLRDLAPGKYDFRGTVVDKPDDDGLSRDSDPLTVAKNLAAARPSPLASMEVVIE